MYLGELSNGRRVAVKWLHGDRSIDIQHCFITELKIQARVKHKNIVTLLGYCFERGERLLVYDYMSNGTVCHHLDDEQSPYLMSWVNRMKVALEIARVIEYLHFCVVPPIIHRDIKTNNIMFDDEWTAVLLDFGDSIVLEEAESAFAGIRGTRGYLDPESLLSSKWTISSDVYSFGVVLLELLTGSQAVYMDENRHRHHLVDLAMQNIGDSHFMDILDRRLQPLSSSFELEAIMRVYQLARACIRRKGKDRPSMIEVVRRLDDALAIYVTGAPGNKITEQYPDSDDLPTPLNEFMEAGSSSPSLSVASSRLEDIPRD